MPTVRLLGGLRGRLGASTLRVEGARVRELLEALVSRGGRELAEIFYDEPEVAAPGPSRDLRVLVNGRSIQFLDGFETALADGDAVTIHLSGARGWPGG
jgi:molybdopterin converting factor small subunit